MPIYAYKCESCGHSRDILQKMSEAPLSECPACGASSFRKQLTAAGFQLKGSGWYATDFKGSGASASKSEGAAGSAGEGAAPSESSKSASDSAGKSDAVASAGGCGASCACHP
ncbi:MAG: zinc ribbon domain-containing protein [Rhodoferax sp.]|nr:zinc ribbon domain-containing protein [Rhodoferax sp.]